MAGFRKKMRQKLQGKNVGGLLQPDAAADAIKPFDTCVATSSVVLGSVDPTPSAAPSSPPPADLLPPAPSTPTPSLWDRAYDDLRKEESRLVEEYEKLLAQEVKAAGSESRDESSTAPVLPQDTTLSPNLQSRQAQLDTVITRGCLRMEEKKGKYSIAGHEFVLVDQVAQAAKFVQWAKDWIGDAVAASPEASIAWSGICLILPLLTNPQTTEEANHDGFIYVTARMRYYTVFEPLLQKLGQNGGVSDALMVETNNHVVSLYQRILEFQIRSVLRFYKSRLKTYAGDAILPYDWEKAIQKIKQQEDMVNEILSQINQFASRNELEILDKASRDAHKTMKDLLLVQEQQLQVQTAQLRLQEDASRQILSDKQNACLQLFYLTNNNKGATYEWYKSRVDERVKDTCMWFLEHDNFQAWLNQDAGPLLVSADPGCGKSVLAKYLIDHILRQRSATVCYYFFKDQDQNTARQALCALLHQLFCARPILIEHAMGPYEERGQRLIESTESLWSIFTTAVRDTRAGRITVVLDALDECAEEEFRDLMQNINGQFTLGDATRPHEAKLKFLMTSRPYEQILSRFRRLSGAFPCIRIPGEDESEKISQEINQVIHYRVDELAREERLSDQIKRHLKDKLLSIEHRTYLWVYLVFDHLRTGFKKTTKGIDATIQTLPKSVNQAYEQILNRSRDDRMVPKVLRIVLAAHRPMTVEEMNIAVNVDSKSKSFDDLDLEDAEDFKSHLRSWYR
ncbi:hypothetical protein SCUCBS95973_002363 [Sporothrix curviconia]|uniref:NWD NACHT-NTPase N-terminal domain-containing protein n=1 Tax=Sporothrix curviconia TaxID=1260050 RepID=A0ABP0B674_9PEZI